VSYLKENHLHGTAIDCYFTEDQPKRFHEDFDSKQNVLAGLVQFCANQSVVKL
jgi:hypothetical protein